MPSRVRKFTGSAVSRRLEAGRGQGEGSAYQPWFYVTEVPSIGTSSVVRGWKHGREHHLLSRCERNYFFLLEWSDDVVDIREQFPLLPLEATLEIASTLGVIHPQNHGQPVVMTTDFMVTHRRGGELRHVARTVKQRRELEKPRILEKLEIERRFFAERGIDWGIVTDADMPEAACSNIYWIHEFRDIRNLGPLTPVQVREIAETLSSHLLEEQYGQPSLAALCANVDIRMQSSPGTSLKVARFLIANKMWAVDMAQRIHIGQHGQFALKAMDLRAVFQ